MTSQEKLDYIYLTLKSFQELLPKTENVVLDVNDDKLHQLSARTLISLDFATSILPLEMTYKELLAELQKLNEEQLN